MVEGLVFERWNVDKLENVFQRREDPHALPTWTRIADMRLLKTSHGPRWVLHDRDFRFVMNFHSLRWCCRCLVSQAPPAMLSVKAIKVFVFRLMSIPRNSSMSRRTTMKTYWKVLLSRKSFLYQSWLGFWPLGCVSLTVATEIASYPLSCATVHMWVSMMVRSWSFGRNHHSRQSWLPPPSQD